MINQLFIPISMNLPPSEREWIFYITSCICALLFIPQILMFLLWGISTIWKKRQTREETSSIKPVNHEFIPDIRFENLSEYSSPDDFLAADDDDDDGGGEKPVYNKFDPEYYADFSNKKDVMQETEENIRQAIATSAVELDLSKVLYRQKHEEETSFIGDVETTYTDERLIFDSIPEEVYEIKSLKNLNLSNNSIARIESKINKLSKLEVLILSNNKIGGIPKEIGDLVNLESLQLDNNKINSLPAEIGHLINLVTLNLSRNQLTTLPAEIGQLTNLTSLDISHNQLTTLPAEMKQLINLKRLNVSKNNLPLSSYRNLPKIGDGFTDDNDMDLEGK
jgi:hypothetical protein